MLNFVKKIWNKALTVLFLKKVTAELQFEKNPVTNQEADEELHTPLHYDYSKKDFVPDVQYGNELEHFDAYVVDVPKIPVTDAYPTPTVTDHVGPVTTNVAKIDPEVQVTHTDKYHDHHFHDKNQKKHKQRPSWVDDVNKLLSYIGE